MIEDFVKLIPESLMDKPGKAFYSGRDAFEPPRELYILGANPGASPQTEPETVAEHTAAVLYEKPNLFSAYRDEAWGKPDGKGTYPPGKHPMARNVLHLFKKLNLAPGEVPASNLVFQRSQNFKELENKELLCQNCWPFHQAVIEKLGVRVVVCMGKGSPGRWVSKRLGARPTGDNFTENNGRKWTSRTYKNADGLYVIALTHSSRAKWTNPNADPTGLVQKAIEQVRDRP